MRKNQVYMTIYASLVTAMFLGTPGAALGLSDDTGPAGAVDDPAADVYPLDDYELLVFFSSEEECPPDVEELPTGHNVVTLEDQVVRIDGSYITYDQFVWIWEGEIPGCSPVFGSYLWTLETEASGIGIIGPDEGL